MKPRFYWSAFLGIWLYKVYGPQTFEEWLKLKEFCEHLDTYSKPVGTNAIRKQQTFPECSRQFKHI